MTKANILRVVSGLYYPLILGIDNEIPFCMKGAQELIQPVQPGI